MAPKPDLIFRDEHVESECLDVVSNDSSSDKSKHESVDKGVFNTVESNAVRMNNFSSPIIEDWNSDDESEVEPNNKVKTVKPSTKKIKSFKTIRKTVEKIETPKQNKHYPKGNQRNWNNLMSGKLKTAGVAVNTVRTVNAADPRPVNTVVSKPTLNCPRPISNAFKRGHSQVTRSFNKYSANKNNIFNKKKVNTVSVNDTTARERAVVSENKGIRANAVKDSACWVWKAKHSSALTTFKKYSYIDARGRFKSIMAWIPKRA
ncbi:hypothetical protein Tco_0833473 [Tanacetum coccineum]